MCIVVHGDTNNTDSVMQRLQHHIISRLNVRLRAIPSEITSYIDIAVSFIPVAIIGLNDENQIFSFSGLIMTKWLDPTAVWDPMDFNNTYAVSIDTSLLWTPQLSAINSVNKLTMTLKAEAFITYDGYIITAYADAYKSSCEMDTGYFPFDEQTCNVLLFPSGRYRIYTPTTEVQLPEYFSRSNEWRLLSVTLENRSYDQPIFDQVFRIPSVVIQFKLKRYSGFYVMSILSPIGILSLMNACVFLLPVESGEKMSFLVSILVSYAMFLNFIYSTMPRSDSLSRLTIYLMLVISQSCLSIVSTVYLLNIYHGVCRPLALVSRTYPTLKVKPETLPMESFLEKTVSKTKISTRKIDRVMFVVFFCLAVFSLMVFIDF